MGVINKSSDSSIAFYFQVDLKKALDLGVIINLDNEFEMEVVDELLKNECKGLETPSIGLRLNPVVGGGTISIFNTATKLSKFGLPLVDETRYRSPKVHSQCFMFVIPKD